MLDTGHAKRRAPRDKAATTSSTTRTRLTAWYGLTMQSHLLRLRVGILLIALSWFPFAQILIHVAHNKGMLTSDKSTTAFRLVVWGIQIVIGLVGVWLVGRVAVEEAKRSGWRRTPGQLWRLFLHGPEAR